MKIKKLGIEWGPAFEEAEAIKITHGDAEIVVFISADHEIVVEGSGNVRATRKKDGRVLLMLTVG